MKKEEKVIDEKALKDDIINKEEKATKKTLKRKIRKKKKLTQADIKKYSMSELDHVILKIKANEVKYTIISVLFMLVVFFIVAYIIFSSVQEHVNHNVLKHGSLYIEFEERENGLGDIIDLVNVDTYSSINQVLDTYEVTITNDSEEDKEYQIFIEDDLDMIEIDKCQDIFLERSFLRYSINDGAVMTLSENDTDSIIFGTLAGKKSVSYTIKVWVSDTYLDNPHYHGKIVVKQVSDVEETILTE